MRSAKEIKLLAVGAGAFVIMATGCATKKYVKNSVHPLEARIGSVDQKANDNSQRIRDLDKKTESGIAEAQNSADQANQAAQKADQAAQTADQHAQSANQLAEKSLNTANDAQNAINNIDNYQTSQSATVLFALNKSTLSPEDKQHLDELADSVKNAKHYVIQIQGYTDTSGPTKYNLALSQARAESVVRYLTLNHNIPLVRIYSLGYGEAAPAAANNTRKGRKLNRRVDVKVLVPQGSQQATSQTPSTGAQ